MLTNSAVAIGHNNSYTESINERYFKKSFNCWPKRPAKYQQIFVLIHSYRDIDSNYPLANEWKDINLFLELQTDHLFNTGHLFP